MLLRRRSPGLAAAVSSSLRRSLTTAVARIPWAMLRHNAPSPPVHYTTKSPQYEMLLSRRLLRLSAAVSGGVRRSLTTAASHPPWSMMRFSTELVGAPGVDVRLSEPPHVSEIRVPAHLIKTSGTAAADPDSRVRSTVCAASDGLFFLTYLDLRFTASIVGKQGDCRVLQVPPADLDPAHASSVTRFVCNPVTRELSRLPDSICSRLEDVVCGPQMGFITQSDRGHGPPDRFAAAASLRPNLMLRFLSERGDWEFVEVSPFQLPLTRLFRMGKEPLAFGGRLWWVDVTCGAVTADPFSDRPELSFVQLPRQSVLPESAQDGGTVRYRRVGVSEGRLRYVEVSQEEPFLLSSFVLDAEGSSWTLEHQVVLNKIWARTTCIPLQMSGGDTDVVLIDPLDANVVYLMVMSQIVGVDMEREEVIESCMCSSHGFCIPCILPPWLGSSRIPSAGKKGVEKNMTLADVLVHSDGHYKR